jgi:hypothetical protein
VVGGLRIHQNSPEEEEEEELDDIVLDFLDHLGDLD